MANHRNVLLCCVFNELWKCCCIFNRYIFLSCAMMSALWARQVDSSSQNSLKTYLNPLFSISLLCFVRMFIGYSYFIMDLGIQKIHKVSCAVQTLCALNSSPPSIFIRASVVLTIIQQNFRPFFWKNNFCCALIVWLTITKSCEIFW